MVIKILIDPGHGGVEPGAVANGYIEKNLNLEYAKLLNAELMRCGFETVMTRATDIDIPLDNRGGMAKKHNCTCLISCHMNNMGDGSGKGSEICYSLKNESAKWLAIKIEERLVALGLPERRIWEQESKSEKGRNYYAVLRSAEPLPGIIIEPLFLDNPNDVKKLKEPDFMKNLAVAICQGICDAYGIKYVPESFVSARWLYETGYTKSVHAGSEPWTLQDWINMNANRPDKPITFTYAEIQKKMMS